MHHKLILTHSVRIGRCAISETDLDEAELLLEAYLQNITSTVNAVRLLQQRIVNTERCENARMHICRRGYHPRLPVAVRTGSRAQISLGSICIAVKQGYGMMTVANICFRNTIPQITFAQPNHGTPLTV